MNTLFETIVSQICSTQDLQRAFCELQKLLKTHAKIEGIFLGHHAPDSHEVYHLAYADSHSSHNLDDKIGTEEVLQNYLLSKRRQEVNVFRMLADFPAMARTLSSYIPEQNSLYEFRVRLDGRHIGMLAFHTPEPNLSSEMLELLMKIRGPIALALVNRLRALGAWPRPGHRAALPLTDTLHVQGNSPLMLSVYKKLQLAAPTSSTLLLTGETGVGKEVYARYAHALSPRNDKAFVHVNCGGIAESLIDSELFGHKKGSFTGAASDHAGFFEQADGGTIFLDEIGELPLHMQARLLLVLQSKSIRKVGDTRSRPLDIRVIAATNCDLERMCRDGAFRTDLYYRLNCITVEIPPLRERTEDIPVLAEAFLQQAARDSGFLGTQRMSPAEMARLMQYPWPGNVRELENCIRRSLIFSGGGPVIMDLPHAPELFPATVSTPWQGGESLLVPSAQENSIPCLSPAATLPDGSEKYSMDTLCESMRKHIEDALKAAGGRVHGPGGAAEVLGIHPSTLRSRMQKLHIPFGRKHAALYNQHSGF